MATVNEGETGIDAAVRELRTIARTLHQATYAGERERMNTVEPVVVMFKSDTEYMATTAGQIADVLVHLQTVQRIAKQTEKAQSPA